MDFVDVMQIGCRSAAIIHSAARYKARLCVPPFNKARKAIAQAESDLERDTLRALSDQWERLVTAFTWEANFYGMGLEPDKGIYTLFQKAFELVETPMEADWEYYANRRILRPLTFSEPLPKTYAQKKYRAQEITLTTEWMRLLLLEEVRRGVALAFWTDAQIDNKADYPAEAVALWDQIIQQAKDFYDYSEDCEAGLHYTRGQLTFEAPGGVYAINEEDLPMKWVNKIEVLQSARF